MGVNFTLDYQFPYGGSPQQRILWCSSCDWTEESSGDYDILDPCPKCGCDLSIIHEYEEEE